MVHHKDMKEVLGNHKRYMTSQSDFNMYKYIIAYFDDDYEDYVMYNTVFYFLMRKDPIGDEFDKIAFAIILFLSFTII